jgi:hypothetical protein
VLAGLRRLLAIVTAIVVTTVLVSVLAGLALGAGVRHSIATGLYLMGSFLLLAGVLSGARGPLRPRGGESDTAFSLFGIGLGSRGARAATTDERRDARATAVLFLGVGLALIVAGVVADSTVELV